MSFSCSCRLCAHWRIGAQNRKWCNCTLVAENTLTAESLAHKTSLSGGGMGLVMSCGPENKHRDTFTHRRVPTFQQCCLSSCLLLRLPPRCFCSCMRWQITSCLVLVPQSSSCLLPALSPHTLWFDLTTPVIYLPLSPVSPCFPGQDRFPQK